MYNHKPIFGMSLLILSIVYFSTNFNDKMLFIFSASCIMSYLLGVIYITNKPLSLYLINFILIIYEFTITKFKISNIYMRNIL